VNVTAERTRSHQTGSQHDAVLTQYGLNSQHARVPTRQDSNATQTRQDPDTTRSSHDSRAVQNVHQIPTTADRQNALNYAIMATTTQLHKVTK